MTQDFDMHEFRTALGSFATGVTVVTTCSGEETPIGVTASSFNSVSLDPPLVLWSLGKTSKSMQAFSTSGHFAVHVLSAMQKDLSNRFAKSGSDKFEGIDWEKGTLGSPLLANCAACFQCKTTHTYEGGDHLIFVGEVVRYENSRKSPLIFHAGMYAEARKETDIYSTSEDIDRETGRFAEDFFSSLLARAQFQVSHPLRSELRQAGFDEKQFLCLSVISMNGTLSKTSIAHRLGHTGHVVGSDTVDALLRKGLIDADDIENVSLSELGRRAVIDFLVRAKSIEETALNIFSPGEIAGFKSLLRRLVQNTSVELPALWDSEVE